MDEPKEIKPTFEVIGRVGCVEVVRVAFFEREDEGFDVVSGVQETVLFEHYARLFDEASHQLRSTQHWELVVRGSISDPSRHETRPNPF